MTFTYPSKKEQNKSDEESNKTDRRRLLISIFHNKRLLFKYGGVGEKEFHLFTLTTSVPFCCKYIVQ